MSASRLDSSMFEVYGSICLARFLDHSSLVSRHLVGVCDCALSPIIVQSILHNLGGATAAASWQHNSATPRLTAVTLVAHKSKANTQSSIFDGGRSFCVPCKCQNLACRVWLLGMVAVAAAVATTGMPLPARFGHAMPRHAVEVIVKVIVKVRLCLACIKSSCSNQRQQLQGASPQTC